MSMQDQVLRKSTNSITQLIFFFFFFRCISQETFDDNCHEVTGDLSLPFPDCCPKFECRDESGNNFIV